MKYIVLGLALSFVGLFVGYTWHTEQDDIKAVFGLGDETGLYGRKSILEDIAYWFFPDKWAEYQDQRLNAQRERVTP